ncbi:MAG: zinc ribbon domain-containing protein, partial [Novosphingobium sp.]
AQVTPQIQPVAAQVVCAKCNANNAPGTRFCGSCGGILAAAIEANPVSVTCDKCNASIPKGSKFCPNCADPVNACPACGEDNPDGAKQCRRGGKVPVDCGNCKTPIPEGVKFCPECGTKTTASCNKCGVDLIAGAKFCNSCGEPKLTTKGV